MYKFLAIPLTMLALVACTKDGDSDTAGGDTDTDPVVLDPAIALTWTADDVTVTLENIDTTGFDFGMAETRAAEGGWYGEDCLNGTAGYQLCHVFTGTTGTLDSLYAEIAAETKTIDDIVAGESTLFDDTFAGALTYIVAADSGCWTWGHDTTYYTGSTTFADCEVIAQ